jgi:hypothetical protein
MFGVAGFLVFYRKSSELPRISTPSDLKSRLHNLKARLCVSVQNRREPEPEAEPLLLDERGDA